jgi:hypothetical protein
MAAAMIAAEWEGMKKQKRSKFKALMMGYKQRHGSPTFWHCHLLCLLEPKLLLVLQLMQQL